MELFLVPTNKKMKKGNIIPSFRFFSGNVYGKYIINSTAMSFKLDESTVESFNYSYIGNYVLSIYVLITCRFCYLNCFYA